MDFVFKFHQFVDGPGRPRPCKDQNVVVGSVERRLQNLSRLLSQGRRPQGGHVGGRVRVPVVREHLLNDF